MALVKSDNTQPFVECLFQPPNVYIKVKTPYVNGLPILKRCEDTNRRVRFANGDLPYIAQDAWVLMTSCPGELSEVLIINEELIWHTRYQLIWIVRESNHDNYLTNPSPSPFYVPYYSFLANKLKPNEVLAGTQRIWHFDRSSTTLVLSNDENIHCFKSSQLDTHEWYKSVQWSMAKELFMLMKWAKIEDVVKSVAIKEEEVDEEIDTANLKRSGGAQSTSFFQYSTSTDMPQKSSMKKEKPKKKVRYNDQSNANDEHPDDVTAREAISTLTWIYRVMGGVFGRLMTSERL